MRRKSERCGRWSRRWGRRWRSWCTDSRLRRFDRTGNARIRWRDEGNRVGFSGQTERWERRGRNVVHVYRGEGRMIWTFEYYNVTDTGIEMFFLNANTRVMVFVTDAELSGITTQNQLRTL